MQVVTQILFWLALASIFALMVVLIIKKIMLAISQSKKLVRKTLVKVLLEKCQCKPNTLMVFNCNDGDILQLKYVPKKECK